MSKRFLTTLASGVALGSAALLLGAPATAFAATDGPIKEPKGQQSKKDDKRKTLNLRDKEGNGIVCAVNDQANELNVSNIISGNTITDSVVVFNQSAAGAATNASTQTLVVCIRDLEVDVEVEAELLGDIFDMVERSGIGRAAAPVGQRAGTIPQPAGAYAGPDGAWVLPATGGVAAGDGGALAGGDTGALVATGAGMMGVAALAGFGLLRRRSADGTVA